MIRQADSHDIYSILRLEEECFPWEAWSSQVFQRELTSQEALFLLDEEEGWAVGYIVAFFDEKGLWAHIGSIAVSGKWQRKGIATRMLKELMAQCRLLGILNFRAETRKSNWHVRDLFAKFGFQEVGLCSNYYDCPREDAVLLIREDP